MLSHENFIKNTNRSCYSNELGNNRIVIGMPYKHTEIIPTLWGNAKCDYTYILSLFGNVSNICNYNVGL